MKTSWITPGPGDAYHQIEETKHAADHNKRPDQELGTPLAKWRQTFGTIQIHRVLRCNLKDMWKHFIRIEPSGDGEENFTGSYQLDGGEVKARFRISCQNLKYFFLVIGLSSTSLFKCSRLKLDASLCFFLTLDSCGWRIPILAFSLPCWWLESG